MDTGTVLVLGAGATLGGQFKVCIAKRSFDPPLDQNFFDSEAVQTILSSRSYPALSYYRQDPNLEATWAKIDLTLKLCLGGVITEEHAWEMCKSKMMDKAGEDPAYKEKMDRESCLSRVPSMAEWELRSLVREVYLDLCPPQPAEGSPLHELVSALWKENMLRGVISFNYDTSLEKLFPGQFYYPLPSTRTNEALPLVKLHGSLNWQESPEARPEIAPIDQIAEISYQNGIWRQPSVIGPTFFKQEITIDFQRDYRAVFYKRLWRFSWDMLSTAQNLIFVGFSFPETDFHVGALFRTAHLNGAGFQHVLLCHRGKQALRNTAEKVFEGRCTAFTEFNCGLENMAERVDKVIALLR